MKYLVKILNDTIISKRKTLSNQKYDDELVIDKSLYDKIKFIPISFTINNSGNIILGKTKKEINNTVISKIRKKYSIDDEFKIQRLGLQDISNIEYKEYLDYVNECIKWGNQEKEKYKLK